MRRLLALALVAGAALPASAHAVRDGDAPPWPSRPPVVIPAGYHADQGIREGAISLGSACMFCPVKGELVSFRRRHKMLLTLGTGHISWRPIVVKGRVIRQGLGEKPLTRSAS